MKTSVRLKLKSGLVLAIFFCLFAQAHAQTVVPELVFKNPVLVSGTALKEGAVYRFPNVATGIDATITLAKFSSPAIVMNTIDNTANGWDKAFQPEFGIPGQVP